MNKLAKQITAALLLAALLPLTGCSGKRQKEAASGGSPETAAPTVAATVQSTSDTQRVLLISLTDYQIPDVLTTQRNDRQADFMMLITVDADSEKASAIQIDPCLPVDFQPQGAGTAETMPLGEIFTYGSGGSDSNLSLLTAISKLMDNVKIDHYITFDSDAVSIAADMLGGVTVDVTDSFPEEYTQLSKGGSVCLNGDSADVYFNYIAPDEADNSSHMRRQRDFIKASYAPFAANSAQEEFVTQLFMKMGEKMDTDLTLSQAIKMMETLRAYELDDDIRVVAEGDT